ncbi:unnamed protein product [Parnassius apollo]|uniref:(apollo) hypothetical protein n=1 Tax=Parnassius apollo TaxID=110799 RepID=A0A8S3W875_PARAO|nr:unnamed protein product [Parnassius apollo]
MLPQVQEWFPNGEFTSMHDSAPCHKAKKLTTFLNAQKVKVLDWPGNSPDLNPIENLWQKMKREISRELITNKRKLIERLIDVWHKSESIKINCSNVSKVCPGEFKRL